jgi:hypothetical protein
MPDAALKGFAPRRDGRQMDFARTSRPAWCMECGRPLPPPRPVGRPRAWCSDACRRSAEKRRRKIASRVHSIGLWEQELPLGRYRQKDIRKRLAALRREVRNLRRPRRP